MKQIVKIQPNSNFVNYLISRLSHEDYQVALCSSYENGEASEVVGGGYSRQSLKNVTLKPEGASIIFSADPVSYVCRGDKWEVKAIVIIIKNVIIASGNLEIVLYDGDEYILNLSNGFMQIGGVK